jgi:hypothetical protein
MDFDIAIQYIVDLEYCKTIIVAIRYCNKYIVVVENHQYNDKIISSSPPILRICPPPSQFKNGKSTKEVHDVCVLENWNYEFELIFEMLW